MKFRSVFIAMCALFSWDCGSLDPFLFNGASVPAYQLDDYQGERECSDALDSIEHWNGNAGSLSNYYQMQIPSGDGLIHGILLAEDSVLSPHDTCLLYFHGNAAHIDFYWPRARLLHATGFPVLIIDYRGFGMSEGTATEQHLYEDGLAARAFLQTNLGNPQTIIVGYSLGSLPACYVASNTAGTQTCALILEAPIASIATLVTEGAYLDLPASYVTTYNGNNVDRIKDLTIPFLWMHGTSDETLDREAQGMQLWNNYHGSHGVYLRVEPATHTNVPQTLGYRGYVDAIRSFCRGQAESDFVEVFGVNPALWGTK